MPDGSRTYGREAKNKGGNVVPALCNVLGTLLIVAVIALCAPVTVPVLMGYQVYDVVSGSMEPAFPVGSAAYVKQADPLAIEVGDVVAYRDGPNIVMHRVTANRTYSGELVTKGDANNVEDFEPVPYSAVLGRVEAHVPFLGSFMGIYASVVGKVYLLLVAACGLALNIVAANMRKRRRTAE